jgi:uncharacterized protein YdaU (DUF1376 family)
MSARPFHKRYHSDALAGFMALTLEERGAYQTLLDMIYDRQGPLVDNERLLAGYMGVSIRKWKSLRETLLEKGKIYLTEDGLIYNSRAKKEIENDAKTSRKLSENGSKGGRKKYENAKKTNENNEGDQAGLEQNSSLYHIPYSRDHIEPPNPQGADSSKEGLQVQGKPYKFEGRTVRLSQRDFDRWATAYHAIPDIRAELQSLDDWLQRPETPEAKRKGWFNLVSRNLGRKHEEALAAKRVDDAEHEAFLRRHPERTFTEDEARALMTDAEFEHWKARQPK